MGVRMPKMRSEALVSEPYLQFIREHPCLYCGSPPPVDPDHARNRGWREPHRNDYGALPTCRRCHNLRHSLGWTAFLEVKKMKVAALVDAQARLLAAWFLEENEDDQSLPF